MVQVVFSGNDDQDGINRCIEVGHAHEDTLGMVRVHPNLTICADGKAAEKLTLLSNDKFGTEVDLHGY